MLEARNITVNYDSREAVVNISLRAEPGEVIAIIGPNGAGKSTLLRALNGSVVPAGGEVLLEGKPLHSYARRVIARHVAVVAQEAELRFPVTVMEFVIGGRYAWSSAWGWESEQDVEIARGILRETELDRFETRLMNELSGGERQRAVVARALATEAKIFLLDEPTANLDLAHQATMLRLIRNRCDRDQAAAVVVTHDVNLASEWADVALMLRAGKKVAYGRIGEVLTEEKMRELYPGSDLIVAKNPATGAPKVFFGKK